MRIGLVIYGSLDIISGGYLYDRKLVEYLQSQGDDVQIVSLPWHSYTRHLVDNFTSQFIRKLRQLDVDVLLQDELNHPSLFLLNRRLHETSSTLFPIVSIVHHLRVSEPLSTCTGSPQMLLYKSVERRYLCSVDGFIFNSQATRLAVTKLINGELPGAYRPTVIGKLEANMALKQPSIVAYPAGDRFQPEISPEEITQRAESSGPLRLLFLGNLIPRKGLHTLLAALRSLPPRSWILKIIGNPAVDPGYTRAIRQQVRLDRMAAQVEFMGSLKDEELSHCLRSSHVLVLPSLYEGFGIAYLEGMSFGLVSIATTAGGAAEIIMDGKDGFLVSPEDPPAIAARLERLAQNRRLVAQIGLAARRRFLNHPTWEQTGATIRNFLKDFLR